MASLRKRRIHLLKQILSVALFPLIQVNGSTWWDTSIGPFNNLHHDGHRPKNIYVVTSNHNGLQDHSITWASHDDDVLLWRYPGTVGIGCPHPTKSGFPKGTPPQRAWTPPRVPITPYGPAGVPLNPTRTTAPPRVTTEAADDNAIMPPRYKPKSSEQEPLPRHSGATNVYSTNDDHLQSLLGTTFGGAAWPANPTERQSGYVPSLIRDRIYEETEKRGRSGKLQRKPVIWDAPLQSSPENDATWIKNGS